MTHRSTYAWIPSEEATELLGVRPKTLYTYASRGWIRTRKEGGRRKLYARADVEALKARADAHAGTEARAAAALHWGEPVLTTEVSGIDPDGPYYRGTPATELLDMPMAQLCALLWQEDGAFPHVIEPRVWDLRDLREVVDRHEGDAWSLVATVLAAVDPPDDARPALVLVAEHGLNASTFTARVIASTGARLQACVVGALAALEGPRHGTSAVELARLLDTGADFAAPVPGFGHPLYPNGDPRAEALLARIPRLDGRVAALIDAAARHDLRPNIDTALLALALHLDEPVARIPLWFAAGRIAGWVAHIREQQARPGLLRPTSAYAGWG